MTGYNFSERVRRVLVLAREEAALRHHEYVGTEHILLGLIRDGGGVAVSVLQNLGVDTSAMMHRLDTIVTPGNASPTAGSDLPYTSRAKKVLEQSMVMALELEHSYVGTEHLLLGMLREATSIAGQVLLEAGATMESARAETLRVLGPKRLP